MRKVKKHKEEFLYDNAGNKTAIFLSIRDFDALVEKLEDLQDSFTVYKYSAKKHKTIPYEKIKKELFSK